VTELEKKQPSFKQVELLIYYCFQGF